MIEVKHLTFGYSKNQKLFSNLNLTIAKGGICGLLGNNGSGKTTLLKIFSGLIFPELGGCKVLNYVPKERRPNFLEEIFFLPEDIYVPALTPEDYVKYYSPFYQRFDSDLLNKCINEFAIPRKKILTSFSYGQKKKFLIAFGLATNCRLFILDEPTNGLDISSKVQFRKLLAGTITDDRLFIISTHQTHDVENLIDSIIILEEGKIILHASLVEIMNNLLFTHTHDEPEPSSCFYYQKHFTGYIVVQANETGQETQTDLEILFNTVLSNKEKIQTLFLRSNNETEKLL